MPAPQASTLAKLTRPRMHGVLARERLFALLDDAADPRRALSVAGPPGCGKTTLVATWLESRGRTALWFQADSGDADLPTFFHYLGRAAEPYRGRRHASLPALTTDYLPEVRAFGRQFFRKLFERLPANTVLVLDNFEEIARESGLHPLLADAVGEVPEGSLLLFVSRRELPEAYARPLANGELACVDAQALRLAPAEAERIVALRGIDDLTLARRLAEACDGWAAGLTLLLEHARRGGALPVAHPAPDLPEVFGYFASQLFDAASVDTQEVLAAMAIPPAVTPKMAEAITSSAHAGRLLAHLCERRLFTHRRESSRRDDPVYQFHALFRAFLLARGQSILGEERRRAIAAQAAALLEDLGETEHAVGLCAESGDWALLGRLVQRHGQALMDTGRSAVLAAWIDRIPAGQAEADPWTRYWRAVALSPTDARRALDGLEAVHRTFEAAGHAAGRFACAQAAVDTYWMHRGGDGSIERWLGVIEATLPAALPSMSQDDRIRAWIAVASIFHWRRPEDPLVDEAFGWLERAFFEGPMSEPHRLYAGGLVMYKAWWTADRALAQRLADVVAPLVARGAGSPAVLAIWHGAYGTALLSELRLDEARAEFETAVRLTREYRSEDAETYLLRTLIAVETQAKRADAAQRHVERLERIGREGGPTARAHYFWGLQTLTDEVGPIEQVLAAYDRATPEVARCEYLNGPLIFQTFGAGMLVRAGRLSEARALTTRLSEPWYRTRYVVFEGLFQLVDAALHLAHGDWPSAADHLTKMLDWAERYGCLAALGHSGLPLLQTLCAEALTRSYETPRVAQLIRWLRLGPPNSLEDAWPWPVKLRVLGAWRLEVDGKEITFAGKSPRKPLALLKILVSLGGREVPASRFLDALWPEADGAQAERSFRVALHRLRTLLGDAGAIRSDDGLVTLDPAHVWVDAFAFEHFATLALANEDPAAESRALALYGGELLPQETLSPCSAPARERARSKFRDLIQRRARRLEAAGDWQAAADTYRAGIAADDVAEALHQGLIRCLFELGRNAEALRAYQSLRRLLHSRLGTQPSAQTRGVVGHFSPGSAA